MMDSLDHKQGAPPINRRFYGDDHYLLNTLDLKYPFPQTHLYPANSLLRGASMNNPGNGGYIPSAVGPGAGIVGGANIGSVVTGPAASEPHMDDPRYVPQDLMTSVRDLDDKRRFYNYPGVQMPGAIQQHQQQLNQSPQVAQMPDGSYESLRKSSSRSEQGLVLPIPPLHMQHHNATKDEKTEKEKDDSVVNSKCSRCKKEFSQQAAVPKDSLGESTLEPKLFKLCHHCRDLQRQRSRRWQKKTKDKHGACRRCGSEIPPEEQKYVLCPQCRQSLRIRKANRAAQGKCVHCLGPINQLIINEETGERRFSQSGSYKVCQRCRENDRIRRTNLERMGNCNRCAKQLSPAEQGKHKVCLQCRQKKKKTTAGYPTPVPLDGSHSAMPVSGLNYIPTDQSGMMLKPSNSMPQGSVQVQQPEYPVVYGHGYGPMLQHVDMFKPVQPMEQQQQFHALQPPRTFERESLNRM